MSDAYFSLFVFQGLVFIRTEIAGGTILRVKQEVRNNL